MFHEAAVKFHCVEAGGPTLCGLTVREGGLERASGRPRGQFLRGGWREDGGLSLNKLGEITRVANHGNVVHVELSLRLVLESFDETLGCHL